jgi:hypothetical protein
MSQDTRLKERAWRNEFSFGRAPCAWNLTGLRAPMLLKQALSRYLSCDGVLRIRELLGWPSRVLFLPKHFYNA